MKSVNRSAKLIYFLGVLTMLLTSCSRGKVDADFNSSGISSDGSNADRGPVVETISNQAATEGVAITTVNANDINSGSDTDIDGDLITWSCEFDNSYDDSVSGGADCNTLPGTINFNTTTGTLDWTPSFSAVEVSTSWEIKITANSKALSDSEIFTIDLSTQILTLANLYPINGPIGMII